jgi:uncharacterized protein (TIGR02145 family)
MCYCGSSLQNLAPYNSKKIYKSNSYERSLEDDGVFENTYNMPLIQFIDPTASASANQQSTTAGGKMKSTSSLWTSPNIVAVSTSGFSALPGGIRQNNGSFSDIRTDTFFWSATEFGPNRAWNRNMEHRSSYVYRDNYQNSDIKSSGLSVRCLRD